MNDTLLIETGLALHLPSLTGSKRLRMQTIDIKTERSGFHKPGLLFTRIYAIYTYSVILNTLYGFCLLTTKCENAGESLLPIPMFSMWLRNF